MVELSVRRSAVRFRPPPARTAHQMLPPRVKSRRWPSGVHRGDVVHTRIGGHPRQRLAGQIPDPDIVVAIVDLNRDPGAIR